MRHNEWALLHELPAMDIATLCLSLMLLPSPVSIAAPACALQAGTTPIVSMLPRRAVPQIIGRMPPAPAPFIADHYNAPPVPAVAPPAPLFPCIAPHCLDAAGKPLQKGVDGNVIDSQGRLCNRDGLWVRCN